MVTCFLLTIINNLDIRRPWCFILPVEANPPQAIDANAVLAVPVATQGFETRRTLLKTQAYILPEGLERRAAQNKSAVGLSPRTGRLL